MRKKFRQLCDIVVAHCIVNRKKLPQNTFSVSIKKTERNSFNGTDLFSIRGLSILIVEQRSVTYIMPNDSLLSHFNRSTLITKKVVRLNFLCVLFVRI